ncbi:hypothetical protein NA56DRAFT_697810 [Hyaloscypha hepaticicola]|uniref:Uncharacterized protein n=1 Tax=Hyaloscypha hepaticicola TaxID=2082293 RepID=A0A2J6QK07_9HELO|nr:hypothetical protein NA56DRAFT_697810 [Hyaloscypha hepaticicola]
MALNLRDAWRSAPSSSRAAPIHTPTRYGPRGDFVNEILSSGTEGLVSNVPTIYRELLLKLFADFLMYYCTKPTPKIETRYQSAETHSAQLIHRTSGLLRIETRATCGEAADNLQLCGDRFNIRILGTAYEVTRLPRFIARFHIYLDQTLKSGRVCVPSPPLTGWIICFNLSSLFQSIGREKSQGKGCRHRHNPYWEILETNKTKNGIHDIFTAPQAKKETPDSAAPTQSFPQNAQNCSGTIGNRNQSDE